MVRLTSNEETPKGYTDALLEEAARVCLQPRAPARSGRGLHILGLISGRKKEYASTSAYLAMALALDPENITYAIDLAEALCRQGRHNESRRAHRRAIALAPTDANGHRRFALTLARQGRLADAVSACKAALMLDATHALTHRALAAVLQASGDLDEAMQHCEAAVRLAPNDPIVYLQRGRLHLETRGWELATMDFERGLVLHPEHVELLVGLGRACLGLGRTEDAIESFRAAATLAPTDLRAHQHLVCALELVSREREAAEAWLSLGALLAGKDRYAEARVAFQAALYRDQESVRGCLGLGRSYLFSGKPRKAIQAFEPLLTRAPAHPAAHIDLGRAFHTVSDATRGWKEFEWFNRPYRKTVSTFEQPLWDGNPLHGQIVLVWSDRALGDAIQALRYVPIIEEFGGRTVVESPARLVSLLEHATRVAQIVTRGGPLPQFDLHVPLFHLASLFHERGTLSERVPYLSVDDTLVMHWRDRLRHDGRLTIGVSWGGNPGNILARVRFVSLRAFAPLAAVPGVRFVSLQRGPQAAECLAPPAGLKIEVLQDESCSLADTAALMESLDLIVTVDTMVAHLAGALGRPVWTLLPEAADWRWLRDTEESPWYPTMRLYRQSHPNNWFGVFERVRDAIQKMVAITTRTSSPQQGGADAAHRSTSPDHRVSGERQP